MQLAVNSRTGLASKLNEPRARVILTLGSAALLFSAIVTVFWYTDVRYSLPTPVPAHYAPPALGEAVPLPPTLAAKPGDTRPTLLHFFNQDCPCSRFNVDQARSLARHFGDRVRFVVVLQDAENDIIAQKKVLDSAQKSFGFFEGVLDCDGKIAERYGVYSTPQAVILDAAGTVTYRGNYNSSRYCVDKATEFARIALEAVLAGQAAPEFPAIAYRAYGCELPQSSTQ